MSSWSHLTCWNAGAYNIYQFLQGCFSPFQFYFGEGCFIFFQPKSHPSTWFRSLFKGILSSVCVSLVSFHIWLNVALIFSKQIEPRQLWDFYLSWPLILQGWEFWLREISLFYPLEIIQCLLKNQKTGWTAVVASTLWWYLTFLQVDVSVDFNSSRALCQLLSLLCSCLFLLFPDTASSELPVASCSLLLG